MLSLVVRADAGRYRVEGCALCALLFFDTPTALPARRLVQRSETVDKRQAVLPILRRSLLNKPGLRGNSVVFGIAGEVVGGWENCSISPEFWNGLSVLAYCPKSHVFSWHLEPAQFGYLRNGVVGCARWDLEALRRGTTCSEAAFSARGRLRSVATIGLDQLIPAGADKDHFVRGRL